MSRNAFSGCFADGIFIFVCFLFFFERTWLFFAHVFWSGKTAKEGGKISERIPVKVEPPFANAVQGYGA